MRYIITLISTTRSLPDFSRYEQTELLAPSISSRKTQPHFLVVTIDNFGKKALDENKICPKVVCSFLKGKELAKVASLSKEFEKAAASQIRASLLKILPVENLVPKCQVFDQKVKQEFIAALQEFQTRYQQPFTVNCWSKALMVFSGVLLIFTIIGTSLVATRHLSFAGCYDDDPDCNVREGNKMLSALWSVTGTAGLAPLWQYIGHSVKNNWLRLKDGWPKIPLSSPPIYLQLSNAKISSSWRLHAAESLLVDESPKAWMHYLFFHVENQSYQDSVA